MGQSNNNAPVVQTEDGKIIVDFGNNVSNEVKKIITNQFKEMTELLHLRLEQQSDEIKDVKKTIESKYISPQQLNALQSLIDKKARKFVNDKKGIQLSIDVLLNYDRDGLVEYQKLVNSEVGKTKSKIWVDLNKDCLERKGTDPKNRILSTQVEQAFDYVRSWGGFSV